MSVHDRRCDKESLNRLALPSVSLEPFQGNDIRVLPGLVHGCLNSLNRELK